MRYFCRTFIELCAKQGIERKGDENVIVRDIFSEIFNIRSKKQTRKCTTATDIAFKICIITFLCLFSAVKTVNADSAAYTAENLCGEWSSPYKHVNITFEEANNSGLSAFQFSSVNTSKFTSVDFSVEIPLNLSEDCYIAFEIKIQNGNLCLPFGIVLFDNYERKRGFENILERYILFDMEWGVIALDPKKLFWETEDFNSSWVTRIRFNSYNAGELYSQTIWIRDLQLFKYQTHDISSDLMIELMNAQYFLSILFLVFISFATGFLIFKTFNIHIPFNSNPILMWPFCAASGLCFLVLVLFSVSLFNLDKIVSISVTSVLLSLFAINIARNFRSFRISGLTRHILKTESLISILVFSLSIVGFSYLAVCMHWPVPGDPLFHGKVVGLIIQDKKLTFGLVSDLQYPVGFQLLSAFLSLITNLYPGQSVLIVGTVVVIILSCLIFSAMYLLTDSLGLSVLSYSLLYILPETNVPMWMPSQNLLVGKYLPGVYPNLLADLIFITFISFQYFYLRNRSHFIKVTFSTLFIFSLLISYPPSLPVLAFFLILRFLLTKQNQSKKLSIHKFLIISFIALCLCLFSLEPITKSILKIDTTFRYNTLLKYRPLQIDSPYFIYTIVIFLALPISIWIIAKREQLKDWSIAFLALFLPTIFGFHEQIYTNFLWFLRVDRLLVLLVSMCYFLLLIGILHLSKKECPLMKIRLLNRFCLRGLAKISKRYSKVAGVVLLTCISVAYFFLISTSVEHYYYKTFNSRIPSGHDFLAMEWLASNVSPEEVILNDRTYAALWLPSFKALNVINDRDLLREIYLFETLNETFLANRTIEANEILAYPWNCRLTERIIYEYNISYIYISDNDKQFKHLGRGAYLPNFPWTDLNQKERTTMYLMNSKMELIFQSGDAAIFKVKKLH